MKDIKDRDRLIVRDSSPILSWRIGSYGKIYNRKLNGNYYTEYLGEITADVGIIWEWQGHSPPTDPYKLSPMYRAKTLTDVLNILLYERILSFQ